MRSCTSPMPLLFAATCREQACLCNTILLCYHSPKPLAYISYQMCFNSKGLCFKKQKWMSLRPESCSNMAVGTWSGSMAFMLSLT